MARINEVKHTCGECKRAELIREQWNQSLDGHYIAMRCEHSKWARLKSDLACEHLKL